MSTEDSLAPEIRQAVARTADDAGSAFSALVEGFYKRDAKQFGWKVESPIEAALMSAMVAASWIYGFFALPGVTRRIAERNRLVGVVTPQAKIGRYRTDFLIEIWEGERAVGSIVVECDGHDFHERTKEQAERDKRRDRELTTLGYRVLRFTGSEIWKSPMEAAADIQATAQAMAK